MGNVPEEYELQTLIQKKNECSNYHQEKKRKWKKEHGKKKGKGKERNIVKNSLKNTSARQFYTSF